MNDLKNCIITQNDEGNFTYNRYAHPYLFTLVDKFKTSYGGNPVPFPSGICAIDSTITCLMKENSWKPVNLIYGNELYCDTLRCFKELEVDFPHLVKLHEVDIMNEDVLKALFQECAEEDKRVIFYFETCSNPSGHIFRFEFLRELKEICSNLRVVVDNTWVSSVLFNPFQFEEVDIVVNSLTKYYGAGQSGILGISIAKTEEFGDILFNYGKSKGLHVSPLYCQSVVEQMETIEQRIKKSSNTTVNIIKELVKNGIEVVHPCLEENTSYERAKQYFGGLYPSVFTFIIPENRDLALGRLRNSKIELSTSFGLATSRFDYLLLSKNENTICRFSVGYEESENYILMNFEELFNDFISPIFLQNREYGNIYAECELCDELTEIFGECDVCYTPYCRNCSVNDLCPCQQDHEELCEKNIKCVGCDSWKCEECLFKFCDNCNIKMCKECIDDDDSLCYCEI